MDTGAQDCSADATVYSLAHPAVSRKLLKPGKTYKVGRKEPADLILVSKTVSQLTAVFDVGQFSLEDVGDFQRRPTVVLRNEHEKKPLHILRAGSSDTEADEDDERTREAAEEARKMEEVGPGVKMDLADGDDVLITNQISISLLWYDAEFQAGSKTDKDIVATRSAACAELGIHIVRDAKGWVNGASHLCIGQVRTTPTILRAVASLAHLVTVDYLDQVLRLGSSLPFAAGSTSLEKFFELPNPADFFPQFVSTELTHAEGKHLLQRQEIRSTLFSGTTVLLVHTGKDPDSRCQTAIDFVRAGGGQVELLCSDDAKLSSEGEAQLTLLPYKENAFSFFSRSRRVQNAPDGGLVVIVVDGVVGTDWRGIADELELCITAPNSMDIKMPDEGFGALTFSLIKCDPRDRLNVTASLVSDQDGISQFETTGAVRQPPSAAVLPPATPLQDVASIPEASLPVPTAATAGSASETSTPLATLFTSEPRPTDTAPPAMPRQDAVSLGSKRPAESIEIKRVSPSGPRKSLSDADHNPLFLSIFQPAKRKPPTGRSNPFDLLVEADSSSRAKSSQMDIDEPASRAEPSQEPAASLPLPPSSSISSAALRRRRKENSTGRMSSIFRFSHEIEGPEGTQRASIGEDESFRRSKPYRALLEEEDNEASQAASQHRVETHGQAKDAAIRPRTRGRSHQIAEASDTDDRPSSRRHNVAEASSHRNRSTGEAEEEGLESRSAASLAKSKRRKQQLQAEGQVIRGGDGPRGKGLHEEPDDEPTFLQALATRRKGKRALDDFDKEFNNLKLAKPVTSNVTQTVHTYVEDDAYNAWKATEIDDFDLPVGNYVQVDYVPLVYKRTQPEVPEEQKRGAWPGVPNFKRFKMKQCPQRKPIVMDLAEQQDFGVGEEYIEKVKFGIQFAEDPHEDMPTTKIVGSHVISARKGATNSILDALRNSDEEDDEDEGSDRVVSSHRTTRGGVGADAIINRTNATRPSSKSSRLGHSSSNVRHERLQADKASRDEDEDDDDDDSILPDLRIARRVEDADFDASLRRERGGPTRTRRGAKTFGTTRAHSDTVEPSDPDNDDDDNDDDGDIGATHMGRRRAGVTATKRKQSVASLGETDDESASDGGFRGFKGAQSRQWAKKKGRDMNCTGRRS